MSPGSACAGRFNTAWGIASPVLEDPLMKGRRAPSLMGRGIINSSCFLAIRGISCGDGAREV